MGTATLPTLVKAADGSWRADDTRPAAQSLPGGRLAALAGLASRYPDAHAVARSRRPLLDRIGPEAAAAAAGARVKVAPPPPAFFPARPPLEQPDEAPSHGGGELMQTVSGGVELVVGPFNRLQELAAFTRALGAVPGVADVSPQRSAKGRVHIRVHYADDVPLANRLAQLREFSPTVLSATRSRIDLKVEPPDDESGTS